MVMPLKDTDILENSKDTDKTAKLNWVCIVAWTYLFKSCLKLVQNLGIIVVNDTDLVLWTSIKEEADNL